MPTEAPRTLRPSPQPAYRSRLPRDRNLKSRRPVAIPPRVPSTTPAAPAAPAARRIVATRPAHRPPARPFHSAYTAMLVSFAVTLLIGVVVIRYVLPIAVW